MAAAFIGWLCAGVALLLGLLPPPASAQDRAAGSAPAGLYVGYYAEDPATNPEDPTLGALYLTLPAGDAAFSGAMNFTYVGCQAASMGTVGGARSGERLSGRWSGTVDGSPQSGDYVGRYEATTRAFVGTYTVAGGKQWRDLSPCIRYVIAPNGRWELFEASTAVPAGFALRMAGTVLTWTNPPGTTVTLLSVLDEAAARAGRPAARFQALGEGTQRFDLARVAGLAAGGRYVVTVVAADAAGRRLGVTSSVVQR